MNDGRILLMEKCQSPGGLNGPFVTLLPRDLTSLVRPKIVKEGAVFGVLHDDPKPTMLGLARVSIDIHDVLIPNGGQKLDLLQKASLDILHINTVDFELLDSHCTKSAPLCFVHFAEGT